MEPRIQYATTSDGVSIAYATRGHGTPLVFMPIGFEQFSLRWKMPVYSAFIERLGANRQLVQYDRRGFGLSDRSANDYSLETEMADLEAVLDALKLESVALLANFVSGPGSIAFAAKHPGRISHLLLYGTFSKAEDAMPAEQLDPLINLARSDWETAARLFSGSIAAREFFPEEALQIAKDFRQSASGANVANCLDSRMDADALASRVQIPTLVLHRQDDELIPLSAGQKLASQLPNAEFVLLEGVVSTPFLGDSQAIVDAIDDFLRDGEETPAAEQQAAPLVSTAPAAGVHRKEARLMEQELGFCTTSDGVSIAYATVGDGPPLVYATGLPGDLSSEWEVQHSRELIQDLAQGFTLIRYDMRGSGLSDRKPGELSFDNWILDLEAVVDHLQLEGFPLLSLGFLAGPICIAYAAAHPERVSHLIMSEAYIRGEDLGTPEQAKAMVDFTALYGILVTVGTTDMSADDLKKFQDVTKIQKQGASLEVQAQVLRTLLEVDVSSAVEKISMPTLIMHSHESQSFPFRLGRDLAAAIPQAKFVPFEEPISAPWVKQERITTAIRRFLGVKVEPKPTPAPAAGQGGAGAADMTRISSPPEEKTFASGRYVVKRLLGQGAQKSVYLVDDTTLERECALSVLNPALLDPSDVDRIKREAQTMAKFGSQPNIVTVYDYGEEEGTPFIVCEYVPGGELRDELAAADGPLPLERALAVAMDICRALSFAHGRDIVHRDLKPENVWLTEERSAKLGDFGIALKAGRTRLTMPGSVSGTALYMAPEQASGGEIDARTDLYAFGVLLYELVAGRPPFVGDDPNAIMYQHVNNQPESPTEHNEAVPPSLEGLILRLLAKTKAERPASAEEVLAELENAATELSGGLSTAAARGAPASSPIEQEIRFCTSADGTRIAYATYGDPAARALVHVQNIHDVQEFCWKSVLFRPLYEELASGGRLVTFDRRGVGGSQRDVDDLAIPAQVADLAAVVDKLGLESFDLVCWFGGGPLAAAYAVEHPEHVRRLVLWHPTINTSGEPHQSAQDMAEAIRANWAFARRSWAAFVYPKGPTELQRWFSNMMRDSVVPEVAARHFEVDAEFDGSTILPSIQTPTLVLANQQGVGTSQSEIASIRTVAALIPDSRLVTLEGATATVVVGNSFLAALRNFLDEADAEAEAKLPSGMTAILFMDIADSTALTTKLGDAAYREKERTLDASLRAAISEAGGTPVEGKVLGDGVMAVFTSARQAIDAAQRCRDLGNRAELPLHLGIHAGDVVREGNNVHGGAVQLAARVQNVAAVGEILVSDIVRGLARTSAGVAFEDRGEHELKGIDEPQRLFAVREQR